MARIALVDHDRNILTSVKMTLEVEGFVVDSCSDGQGALEASHRKQPDIAVLYIKMSRMDGWHGPAAKNALKNFKSSHLSHVKR